MAFPGPDSILVPATGTGLLERAGKLLRILGVPKIPVQILTLLVICAIFAPHIQPDRKRYPLPVTPAADSAKLAWLFNW